VGDDLHLQLRKLQDMLFGVALYGSDGLPKWKWMKFGKFTVKSMYKHLSSNGLDRSFGRLWMARIPFKITIWLSLILHNAISTKDNMTKKTEWETQNACFVIRRRHFCTLNVQPLICMVSGGYGSIRASTMERRLSRRLTKKNN
jgi:hypothetical protein